jgi:hypothetical protein
MSLSFYRVQVDATVDDEVMMEPYEVIVIAGSYAEAQVLATEEVRDRLFNNEAVPGYKKVEARARSESAVDIIPDKARIVAVEEPYL